MPLGFFIVWVYFTGSSPWIEGKSNFYAKHNDTQSKNMGSRHFLYILQIKKSWNIKNWQFNYYVLHRVRHPAHKINEVKKE